jgi:phosphoglycerate kinase
MRVDFNVPLKDGKVKDPTRIASTVPSIKKILGENVKSLVLASHLGRPDGNVNAKFSLAPTVPVLEELLGKKVTFLKDCVG